MNISSLRESLRDWFSTLARIDSFQLDVPADLYSEVSTQTKLLPANTLREYPAENLSYQRTGINTVVGSGTFPYSLIFRYAGEISYHQLPLSELESLVEYIQVSAILNPPSCAIRSIEADALEATVNPQRDGTNQEDWIVYCNFSLTITFNLSELSLPPDFGTPPEEPIPGDIPTELRTYKSKDTGSIDAPGNDRLDATYQFNFEE